MMKRLLVVVLLMSSAVQANGLKKAWNNFGKGNKAIYGGKALVAGYLAYTTGRAVLDHGIYAYQTYQENADWFEVYTNKDGFSLFGSDDYDWPGTVKAEIVPRKLVLAGISGYVSYLLLKQTWHDAKHAVGKK